MEDAFAREVTIRALLKAKGYQFDHDNQYWIREWSTNQGEEKVLEVALQTEDGEWNKLMMTPDGQVFHVEVITGSV